MKDSSSQQTSFNLQLLSSKSFQAKHTSTSTCSELSLCVADKLINVAVLKAKSTENMFLWSSQIQCRSSA